jgi:DNA-binding winged helix-turn-helix (wHTH) protein
VIASDPRSGSPAISADAIRHAPKEIIEFGPFRLRVSERLLEKEGVRIGLGSRALDILIALLERAPEIFTKRALIARVWGDLVVGEGSLRFHIGVLRKALGEKQSGIRYVSNVAGRGYCFVAPISHPAAAHENRSATFHPIYFELAPFERLTLRRLSVFGGMFPLEAAQSIFPGDIDRLQLIETIAALVEKSIVMAQAGSAQRQYRLPGLMRDYLRMRLIESGEHCRIARRYAIHCKARLLCEDEFHTAGVR